MIQEHLIDFLWGDFFPAAVDHLAYAAGEKPVAVVIEVAQISGLKPLACKCRGSRIWVAIIAGHDGCAPDDDLSALTAGQQGPDLIQDPHVQVYRQADGTGLARPRPQRIARDRRCSNFRHAVPLDCTGVEAVLELGEDAGRQRRGRRAYEAKPGIR